MSFLRGPCLGTGAPWPGVGAATVNTLSPCLWWGICMCVPYCTREPVGNACGGGSHGPLPHKAPRPCSPAALAVKCRALVPHKQHRCNDCSMRGPTQPVRSAAGCASLAQPAGTQARSHRPPCPSLLLNKKKCFFRAGFQWQAGGLISPECRPLV